VPHYADGDIDAERGKNGGCEVFEMAQRIAAGSRKKRYDLPKLAIYRPHAVWLNARQNSRSKDPPNASHRSQGLI
jgi:hypothetical protein